MNLYATHNLTVMCKLLTTQIKVVYKCLIRKIIINALAFFVTENKSVKLKT